MRAVLQRCINAQVKVNNKIVGEINNGFVVFLGIGKNDNEQDLNYLVKKICGLRIFEDQNEKMNLNPKSVGADLLVISNFTLYANTTHGFRPDFLESMMPIRAEEYVNKFIDECKKQNVFNKICSGVFGADMNVIVSNDGPVNIIFDTERIKNEK